MSSSLTWEQLIALITDMIEDNEVSGDDLATFTFTFTPDGYKVHLTCTGTSKEFPDELELE